MEEKRPDFEFDEFFYDDEEENGAAEKLLFAEEPFAQESAKKKELPEEKPSESEEDAPPADDLRPAVRMRGKVTKRVKPSSLLPLIDTRIDALLTALYEEGLLEEAAQEGPETAGLPRTDATMPLNVKAPPLSGTSYVLVDALTNQMVSIDGNLRIGRDASFADLIPAGNNTVSAQHAELSVKQNVLIVRDIGPGGEGSSNGTFVNGVRIPLRSGFGVEAREGDILEFSNAKYRVEKL